jgi:uncharacterized membrane protein (UPF0127 family)
LVTEIKVRREDGKLLCERCLIADSPLSRVRGLLGRRSLAGGEGLLLRPAASVHTWFMRFPIDAVFISADGTVVRIADDLRPWRAAGRRGARAVLELASGECARHGLKVGDRLIL